VAVTFIKRTNILIEFRLKNKKQNSGFFIKTFSRNVVLIASIPLQNASVDNWHSIGFFILPTNVRIILDLFIFWGHSIIFRPLTTKELKFSVKSSLFLSCEQSTQWFIQLSVIITWGQWPLYTLIVLLINWVSFAENQDFILNV